MEYGLKDLMELYVRGTQVNYYFVCRTKLWLFSHNISMERESDLVKLGELLHREVYSRKEKEVRIGPIAIDVVDRGDEVEIREVKKSDKIEKAHVYQTLYYLYFLKAHGIKAKGKITYPKQKKVVDVELSEEAEEEIEKLLGEIESIVEGDMPEPEYRKICRKCAYYEFCFC